MLCSLIWSQKKKKSNVSFLSEVLLEAGKSGLLQACRAGPRAGRGWGLTSHPLPMSSITWSSYTKPESRVENKMPPQRLPGSGCVEMREAGSPGIAGGLVSSTECVCVCEYPRLLSLTLPGLAPLA
ncbi:unnamed protein product [Rangifer tarandus platyrhynchus]|uniref:Uncharacterized protein n=1 Tax=Rangifer tarandus platyrhynchus TaxID=3082113 RepID=A0ABN8YZ33_RANTA|nr:unnamed protein product [Rangifer tarandus platyrhynchus]